MKVLLVAPDLAEALPLADAADEARFVTATPTDDPRAEVLLRGDPRPTHWMREASVAVTRRLRGLLHTYAPDVVHVLGWTRLTSDPVLTAARAGVPAVVDLVDHRVTCLLHTRRRPDDGAPCERTYGPYECVPCAGHPQWVARDRAYLAFGERAAALGREFALARARLVPDEEHGEALVRALGAPVGPVLVAPPAGHPERVAFHADLYRRVAAAGPPSQEEAGTEPWFEERMRAAAEAAWDEAASRE